MNGDGNKTLVANKKNLEKINKTFSKISNGVPIGESDLI